MTTTTTSRAPEIGPANTSAIANWFNDGWITTRRNLIKIKRVPDILVFTTLQPIMFVLLFTYVYAGVIEIPGSTYTEFIMAGIFAQTVVFGSTYSGSAMAQDLRDGIIDRFRTLPMSPSAVLIGRTNGDLLINSISMGVMMATGFIVGWRIRSSAIEAIGGVALLLLFAYALSWVMAFLGMSVRSPEVINNVSFLILFPLTFLSNAFVPIDTLPTPLRIFAEYNPVVSARPGGQGAVRQRSARSPAADGVAAAVSERDGSHRRDRGAADLHPAVHPQVHQHHEPLRIRRPPDGSSARTPAGTGSTPGAACGAGPARCGPRR